MSSGDSEDDDEKFQEMLDAAARDRRMEHLGGEVTRLMQQQRVSYEQRMFRTTVKGEIWCGDVVEVILGFVEPDPRTLFAVSEVSRGWRERAEYLPQWEQTNVAMSSKGVTRALDTLSELVPNLVRAPVHSREAFISYRRADLEAQSKAIWAMRAQRVKYHIMNFTRTLLVAILFVPVLAVFALWYAMGSSRKGAFDTDAKIGIAQFFFNLLLMGPAGLAIFLYVGDKMHAPFRRLKHAATTLIFAALLTSFSLGMVLALLGARYKEARLMRDTPIFEPTCNISEGWQPSENATHERPVPYFVEVPRAILERFSPVSNKTSEFLELEFFLVADTTSLCTTAAGGKSAEYHPMLAVMSSVIGDWEEWTQKRMKTTSNESSIFLRTGRDNYYFHPPSFSELGADQQAAVRSWFDHKMSHLWGKSAIPLVFLDATTPPPAAFAERYRGYVDGTVLAILIIFSVAALSLCLPQPAAQACSLFFAGLTGLVLNTVTLTIFGAICLFRHPAWCMATHGGAMAMFLFGAVPTLVFLIGGLLSNCC